MARAVLGNGVFLSVSGCSMLKFAQNRGAAAGLAGLIALAAGIGFAASARGPSDTDAHFRITGSVAAAAADPVSATIGSFSEGKLMPGGNFEPVQYRTQMSASADAPQGQPDLVPVSPTDLTSFDSLREGALDGAELSVLRIENGTLREVRRSSVAAGGFVASGWMPSMNAQISVGSGGNRADMHIDDWERGGVPRWFSVRAYDRQGRLSDYADAAEIAVPETRQKPEPAVTSNSADNKPAFEGDAWAAPDRDGPAAPTGLSARYEEPGRVILNWDGGGRGIAGYIVYRSYTPPQKMRGFRLELNPDGGVPVRQGDMLILRKEFLSPRPEDILSDRIWGAGEARWTRPRLIDDLPDDSGRGPTWTMERHPDDAGQDWGQNSFLRVNLPGSSVLRIGTHNHSGTAQDWYHVLQPGVPYRVSVRLRGDRPGQAVFRLAGPYARSVPPLRLNYGTEWAEVSGEFTVPETLTDGKAIGRMDLALTGPGQVDVDDLRVHRADTPFMDFAPEDYDRLSAAGLSALRTHGLIKTGMRSYDLAALLGEGGILVGGSYTAGLPETLRMMEKAGVSPWLQIEPHLNPDEWLGLAEYLAAPFDPAVDDAEKKPWAALRVAQGRRAPWTDAFDHIWFEVGNETWNRLFAPWTFSEMTDAGTGEKYGAGQVYGFYHAYVASILRDSPWWQGAGLDDKVTFVIGGWAVNNYGGAAATAAGDSADLVTIAAYNGGWDEKEDPVHRDKASYASVLSQVSQVTEPRTRELAERTAAVGGDLAYGTYEAGPGYSLNGLNGQRVTPEQAAEQEQVMKGRAAGVATLDTFLMQRQMGMTMQNFFTFGEGTYWKSHLPWHLGGDPYPSWSLVTLLNGVGAGEMLTVDTLAAPARDLPEIRQRQAVRDAAEIAVYASRQDNRLTVFAISRRVPGYPEGGDDGCTPVTVELPVKNVASARLIRTAGSYDDNGVSGPKPVIEDTRLPTGIVSDGILRIGEASGAESCGLPAASAYIYVFEMAGK